MGLKLVAPRAQLGVGCALPGSVQVVLKDSRLAALARVRLALDAAATEPRARLVAPSDHGGDGAPSLIGASALERPKVRMRRMEITPAFEALATPMIGISASIHG